MKNSLPKVLITGGSGQLARALREHYDAEEFEIFSCSRNELDITNSASIENAFKKFSPDIVINTAAYTAVDKAEEEQALCLQVNALGASNLAESCNRHQSILMHVSTDYIFDGSKKSPYEEEDLPYPLNFYGQSKLVGETKVRQLCEKHIILRVSGVFSPYGNNFVKTILRLAREKNELRVVADQFTCPTDASDIASALFSLVKKRNDWGTYHYCSEDILSWHDFAIAILQEAEQQLSFKPSNVKAIATSEFKTLAKRPSYSVVNCSKIQKTFGIHQPRLRQSLTKVIASLLQEKS